MSLTSAGNTQGSWSTEQRRHINVIEEDGILSSTRLAYSALGDIELLGDLTGWLSSRVTRWYWE